MYGPAGAIAVTLLTALAAAAPPGHDSVASDEKLLRDLNLAADGPGLVEFFRRRTPTSEQVEAFQAHLANLTSDVYADRARASDGIIKMGPAVRPLLLQVLNHPPADREIVRRVEHCLVAVRDEQEVVPALAAARLLAAKKPAGASQALLAFVPFAANELVRQEAQRALNALAFQGRTPDPLLTAGLRDTDPYRRAAAAEALARGDRAFVEKVAPLLKDAHAQVRLQVGLALVELGRKEAVPVLVELLGTLPGERAWPAQELLLTLAEDAGEFPPTLDGRNPPRDVVAGWQKWWKQHGGRVNVARLADPPRVEGYTLLTHGTKGLNGRVVELGPDREIRWEIDGLRYPFDVQYLGRGRILVAEFYGKRVTERDTKGNVLWEKPVNMPIACQRFPDGHTFIACRNQLVLVDRAGTAVFTYNQQNTSILAAQRLRDGRMVLVNSGGIVQVLDPRGQVIKSFRGGQVYTMGSSIEVLSGGRILMPLYSEGRVVEYDLDGNLLWQARVAQPTTVTRLANGNTLVGSQLQSRVVEIDPAGQEVWKYTTPGRPWRARRR